MGGKEADRLLRAKEDELVLLRAQLQRAQLHNDDVVVRSRSGQRLGQLMERVMQEHCFLCVVFFGVAVCGLMFLLFILSLVYLSQGLQCSGWGWDFKHCVRGVETKNQVHYIL